MASLQKRKSKGGNYYWYIVESKRIKGKPTPIVVAYLGTVENILNKFTGTNNVKDSSDKKYKSYMHGSVTILWEIAKKLGVHKILDSVFPDNKRNELSKGTSILLAAIQRAIEPGSKREFSEWSQSTTLPSIAKFDPLKMTSQHFWEQMDGISENMLIDAEDQIIKAIFEKYNFNPEKIALDYTNYFTYIDSGNEKSTLSKRGHNKQKRNDLRQFSLALFTTKEMMLPLCSYVYEGNINDFTVFPKYFKMLKERIAKYSNNSDITIIFDKGSVSKDNLNQFEEPESNFKYICSFSFKSCKELLNIPLESYYITKARNNDILTYRIKKTIWNKERDCILIFSENLKEGQLRGFQNDLSKKIDDLVALREQIKNEKSKISKKSSDIQNKVKNIIKDGDFADIINIKYIGKRIIKDIQYTIDEEVMKAILKDFGKKLMITNKFDWSTEEIIQTYLEQSNIEDIFKDTKNPKHFAIRPQFHWTDSKVRVHTFCCLLGMMLTVIARKELMDTGIKVENDRLIEILSQIRQMYVLKANKKKKSGFDVDTELEEMSAEQSDIWLKLYKKI